MLVFAKNRLMNAVCMHTDFCNPELFKCCPQMSGIKSLAYDNILM